MLTCIFFRWPFLSLRLRGRKTIETLYETLYSTLMVGSLSSLSTFGLVIVMFASDCSVHPTSVHSTNYVYSFPSLIRDFHEQIFHEQIFATSIERTIVQQYISSKHMGIREVLNGKLPLKSNIDFLQIIFSLSSRH